MASEEMKKAVKEKDIIDIRGCLIANIFINEDLSGIFKEDLAYCLSNGISENELYESHNGEFLSTEITEKNYKNLHEGLTSNFSKERIEALQKVAAQLYPPKAMPSQNNQSHSSAKPQAQNKNLFYIAAGAAILVIFALLFAGK